jgi:hypothetical protein
VLGYTPCTNDTVQRSSFVTKATDHSSPISPPGVAQGDCLPAVKNTWLVFAKPRQCFTDILCARAQPVPEALSIDRYLDLHVDVEKDTRQRLLSFLAGFAIETFNVLREIGDDEVSETPARVVPYQSRRSGLIIKPALHGPGSTSSGLSA